MNSDSEFDKITSRVLFVDMNSFFATCEQQINYWVRGKPVCVAVYTGKHGVIIAPSIEAKALGIKLGMRLSEAMRICPDIIPIETHPKRYREFHIKVMNVLRKYSEDVIPKSIDEAIVDLTNYKLLYKNPVDVARKIKADIRREVGEWMKCSIGIAPNAFLAKLGSNLKKPDGLVVITPETIDEVLKSLQLVDLPGISTKMAERLHRAGIHTPLQLRHSPPEKLKRACNSIVGVHWHYRLHFKELDQKHERYKSMQARRAISLSQRQSVEGLQDLFMKLSLKLESRMVNEGVFTTEIGFFSTYESGKSWKDFFRTGRPVQDGMEVMNLLKLHMKSFENAHKCEPIINTKMISMGISVSRFVKDDLVQLHMFENNVQKDNLRKLVYNIKDKFGSDKLMRGIELRDEEVLKDAIGFGSVKDMYFTKDKRPADI
ncbi:MAG: DNA polymerase IV [Flavobacteriales bacterium]|nr:MAG: DNA polymerase IV [Flavobacteriales bacterium]